MSISWEELCTSIVSVCQALPSLYTKNADFRMIILIFAVIFFLQTFMNLYHNASEAYTLSDTSLLTYPNIIVNPVLSTWMFAVLSMDSDKTINLIHQLRYRYPDVQIAAYSNNRIKDLPSHVAFLTTPCTINALTVPNEWISDVNNEGYYTNNAHMCLLDYAKEYNFENIVFLDDRFIISNHTDISLLWHELSKLNKVADIVSPEVCWQQSPSFIREKCITNDPDSSRQSFHSMYIDDDKRILQVIARSHTNDPRIMDGWKFNNKYNDDNINDDNINDDNDNDDDNDDNDILQGVEGRCYGVDVFPSFFIGKVNTIISAIEKSFINMNQKDILCLRHECHISTVYGIQRDHTDFILMTFFSNLKAYQCSSTRLDAQGDSILSLEFLSIEQKHGTIVQLMNKYNIKGLISGSGRFFITDKSNLIFNNNNNYLSTELFMPSLASANQLQVLLPNRIDISGDEWNVLKSHILETAISLYNSKTDGYRRINIPSISIFNSNIQSWLYPNVFNALSPLSSCCYSFEFEFQPSFVIDRDNAPDRLNLKGVYVDPSCPFLYSHKHAWSHIAKKQINVISDNNDNIKIENIYFITTMKNQCEYASRLVEQLKNLTLLQQGTENTLWKLHLIITDFNSNECDTSMHEGKYTFSNIINHQEENLKLRQLPIQYHHEIIYTVSVMKICCDFSRSKGLNFGFDYLKTIDNNPNALIFMVDTSMILPMDIFSLIRTSVICGYTVYVPVCTKIKLPSKEVALSLTTPDLAHEYISINKPYIYEVHAGYGMVATCQSDFSKVHGYDYDAWGNLWGMEDTDLLRRFVQDISLLPIRRIEPNLFHISYSSSTHRGRDSNEPVLSALGVAPHVIEIVENDDINNNLYYNSLPSRFRKAIELLHTYNEYSTLWKHIQNVLNGNSKSSICTIRRVEKIPARYKAVAPTEIKDTLGSKAGEYYLVWYEKGQFHRNHEDVKVALLYNGLSSYLVTSIQYRQPDIVNSILL